VDEEQPVVGRRHPARTDAPRRRSRGRDTVHSVERHVVCPGGDDADRLLEARLLDGGPFSSFPDESVDESAEAPEAQVRPEERGVGDHGEREAQRMLPFKDAEMESSSLLLSRAVPSSPVMAHPRRPDPPDEELGPTRFENTALRAR